MRIDREEARRVAGLARIDMDEAALDRMAAEMSAILTYIDQIAAADPAGAASPGDPLATVLREDVPGATLERELVAGNAPDWADGFFAVPKVIGE